MPKVSVIIPCFNLGQYLDDAVESVLAQTFEDLEIVIVNDGSTDQFTKSLLANYHKPKTRVLTTENQGLPSARNNGIRVADGEYVCCLDADDRYAPEFVEKAVGILDQDSAHQLGFVTSMFQAFGEKNEIWETLDYDPIRLAMSNVVHVASMFRKECWEKVGGYATNLTGYQDWNFWISIVAKGFKWHRLNTPLFQYRVRPNSMVTVSNQNKSALYKQIILNNPEFYHDNYVEILLKFSEVVDGWHDYADQLNIQVSELSRSTELLTKEASDLRSDIDVLNNRIRDLSLQLSVTEADNRVLQAENGALQAENETLQAENRVLQDKCQELEVRSIYLDDILNSFSWRMMRKLHNMIDLITLKKNNTR